MGPCAYDLAAKLAFVYTPSDVLPDRKRRQMRRLLPSNKKTRRVSLAAWMVVPSFLRTAPFTGISRGGFDPTQTSSTDFLVSSDMYYSGPNLALSAVHAANPRPDARDDTGVCYSA